MRIAKALQPSGTRKDESGSAIAARWCRGNCTSMRLTDESGMLLTYKS